MVTTTIPPTGDVLAPDMTGTDRQPHRTAPGRILVATDATESADAALMAAQLIVEQCAADVDVVAVLERPPIFVPAPYPMALPLDYDGVGADALRDRARRQVAKVVGENPRWTVETRFGIPAQALRRAALDRDAELVITGVSRHTILDRVFGEETPAQIAQTTETPMLAATPSMTRLPRTVLIAVDLDSPGVPNTPLIRALLSQVTTAYFVNAKPRIADLPGFESSTWELTYNEAMGEACDRVKASLDLPLSVYRQLVTLPGNPAKEILSFATYAKVDLIILGQRRRWTLHRRFGGGVPTRVLRGTTCPVLILPRPRVVAAQPAAPAPAAHGHRTETLTERSRWAPRLAQLSRQNAGRRVTMEIDDVELGAQAQAIEFPFVGMDYDHRDDRVEILLGERAGRSAHLTHSVVSPVSIEILEGKDGKALAIRVGNDRGAALLTFLL